jgi:2-succinyl-5-enolpyruvyl-6-hydroxy-3-cyclohexene-1-carboxylate synthase
MAFAGDDRFKCRVHLDERSGAFFALGVGKATGCPAVIVTTSGTATANVFPAVIEASGSETPLLVLTADRPHHLRDSDANQAIDQIRLFGPFVRDFFEVAPPVRPRRTCRRHGFQ